VPYIFESEALISSENFAPSTATAVKSSENFSLYTKKRRINRSVFHQSPKEVKKNLKKF
jgi:hypothetical protein